MILKTITRTRMLKGGGFGLTCGHGTIIELGSEGLGPSFYHYGDNGDYAQWLRDYPESKV